MPSGGGNRLSVTALRARGTLRASRHRPQATCEWCDRPYRPAVEGCAGFFTLDGKRIDRVPFESDRPAARCGDCGVGVAQVHHGYCGEEECTRCGGLLMVCGHANGAEVWL